MKDYREDKKDIPEEVYDNMRKDRTGRPLCNYLEKMFAEGKTEFRVAMQNGKWFIIHPMNIDGETLDVKWGKDPSEEIIAIW